MSSVLRFLAAGKVIWRCRMFDYTQLEGLIDTSAGRRLVVAYSIDPWCPSISPLRHRRPSPFQPFAREFNTPGDRIDSWDQRNMSLIYHRSDGKWKARLWVRNIQDEDNVTSHYLIADTSDYFRYLFLTEPRIWGATVRYYCVPCKSGDDGQAFA